MNRKTISFLRLAVCLVFVMTLLTGTAAPSLAQPPTINAQGALVGSEQNPADAAITKRLRVGMETVPPNTLTYTFKIDKVNLDGLLDANTLAVMPTIADKTISFGSNDFHPMQNNMSVRDLVEQTDNLHKESSTLFPAGTNWTRAGIYVYRVTEVQSVTGYFPNAQTETLTFSKAQYDLHVYVAERTPPATGYYVWAIGAYRILTDDGNTTGGGVGNKVNPQPGGDPQGPINERYSKMIFTNSYLRSGGGGSQPSDARLRIGKKVTGLGANSTLYFNFDVTVRKPAISTKTSYRVYVFETNAQGQVVQVPAGQLQNNVQNPTLINMGGYIEYQLNPPGQAVRFMLKHNQFLSFSDIDAGATYIVNELGTQLYTPSVVQTKSNVASPVQSAFGSGQPLSTPTTPPTVVTIAPVGAAQWIDSAEFSNLRDTITPTGINVDDLPYFAIIAVAAIALGGYLFFRVRTRKHDEAAVEAN